MKINGRGLFHNNSTPVQSWSKEYLNGIQFSKGHIKPTTEHENIICLKFTWKAHVNSCVVWSLKIEVSTSLNQKKLHTYTVLTVPIAEILSGKNWMNDRHPLQLKKSKFWEPFWSYQLNSTANLAQLWGKWAGLAFGSAV